MQIVSGNYRDHRVLARRRTLSEVLRGEPKKTGVEPPPWLMRSEDQSIRAASTFNSIVATDVTFGDGPNGEEGFGCWVVAFCKEAGGFEAPPVATETEEVPLNFDRINGAFFSPDRRIVTGCKRLRLLPDKSILALEPVYEGAARSAAA